MTITAAASSPAPGLLRRAIRWTGLVVVILLVAVAAGVGYGYRELRRSLPRVDGEAGLRGLSAPVRIERDARGVPTVRGATRIDVARALGFMHAQERFFQMDLARRRAAGELSELVGPGALPLDRGARLHRFRAKAHGVLASADADSRAIVEAYAEGVNAGLQDLGAPPFEYLALRTGPAPWVPEDSVLVLASMFFQLQDADGTRDLRIGRLYDELPAALADFLSASGSEWDTPLTGEAFPAPWIPGPEVIDLRRQEPRTASARPAAAPAAPTSWQDSSEPEQVAGSNYWAVGGAYTATGAAIVANDMHLGIAIPNIWYRASLVWSDAASVTHTVTGVTLPGLPSLVVGSNGRVAWGFTNSTGDWTDVVEVTVDPADPNRYLTPDGPRPFERVEERIRVHGAPDERLEIRETIWGPVLPADGRGRLRAIHWVPAVPGGLTIDLRGPETMTSVAEALDVGPRLGIPAQNFVVADRDGHIGWTIAGRIPRRIRLDARVPQSWADGERGWAGWLSPDEYPRVVDPPSGRIVTANNRLVDGEWLSAIGDGGYDQGARARQIRDDVQAIERATPADMLRVQLDDRALFFERWRKVVLDLLTPAAVGSGARRQFRDLAERTWTGRASIDSVAYRLVRTFRLQVAELAFESLIAPVRKVDPAFPPTLGRAYEGQLWELVTERPAHMLPPKYTSWDALLLAAVDRTIEQLSAGPGTLADRSWGEFNRAHVIHPLARAVPMLASWPFAPGWFAMPADPLPGDVHMPRIQTGEFGASERFAVSPGRESEGYFHMPVGQSGHPLSPNFSDGHRAWVAGEPTPFLPGPTTHTLTLSPRTAG